MREGCICEYYDLGVSWEEWDRLEKECKKAWEKADKDWYEDYEEFEADYFSYCED